jgi:NitT/TauT family transport system substrate-binding protein
MHEMVIDRRKLIALLGATAAVSMLSGPAMAATPLNFGYDESAGWGALGMVAKAKGTFKKAGADVGFFTFDSGKTTRDAMVSGHVDLGILGATPFIIGAAKGDMEAIAMAMYAGKTDSVLAGAKSGITSIKDLKGRRVASQLGTATNYVFVNEILPKYGLSASDIHIINTQGGNMIAALVSGSVDAIVDTEPFISIAEVDGLGKVIVNFSSFDMLPVVLAANRPVVAQRPKELVAFLRGWIATVKLFETQPAEVAKILRGVMEEQGFKISDKATMLMLSKLGVNTQYVPGVKAYMEAQSKVLLQQHVIDKLPDWNKLINRSLLKEATVA